MSARHLRLVLPAVVVVLLAGVLGWAPARSAESRAEERADAALRVVDDLTWELDDLDTLVSSTEALRAEQALHEAAIPPDHQLAEFILYLEALSASAGVDVIDVVPTSILGSFDDLSTPTGTSSVLIAVALGGGFAETIAFLDGLAALPRLVVVEGVAIGFNEVDGTLAIDLELRVFTTRELVEFTDEFLDDFDDDLDDEGFVDGDGFEEEGTR